MVDETGKIHRICEYPLAAHIQGALRSTFADSSHGYTGARSAMIINAFLICPNCTLCATSIRTILEGAGYAQSGDVFRV